MGELVASWPHELLMVNVLEELNGPVGGLQMYGSAVAHCGDVYWATYVSTHGSLVKAPSWVVLDWNFMLGLRAPLL